MSGARGSLQLHRGCPLSRFCVLVAGILFLGCATTGAQRIGVDDSGGTDDLGLGSQDFRTITERMASSLAGLWAIANAESPPRIAFLEVENRSSDVIDTKMFLEKTRTLLLSNSGGRYRFLDRDNVDAIMLEREAKRAGIVTSSGSGNLGGADFFLTGSISSIDQVVGSQRTTYMRFAFRLVDAETSDIVWEDEYEMKKLATRAFWDK